VVGDKVGLWGQIRKGGEGGGKGRPGGHKGPRCREKKKAPAGNFHLRDEEVVTRKQIKRRFKVHRELYFQSGHRTVAACSLIGLRIYSTGLDAVVRREVSQTADRKA